MTTILTNEWWRVAACRDAEPELFFPLSATSASSAQVRRAKLICASCQVRSACLDYALDHRQEQGIWGGLTEEERRRIPRRSLQFSHRDV
ncbi:MAG TPA: WhiB family transcriptional regulator [Streptosporangiaceae bacterium]|nr:WhiB family transcriptional regulator [Streptosporangiaceae bacterium]